MEYTDERAMEWLNKHWNTPKSCPICKHKSWGASESVVEIREYRPARELVFGGPVYPLFLITCNTCGLS
jgi:hypothetical protein